MLQLLTSQRHTRCDRAATRVSKPCWRDGERIAAEDLRAMSHRSLTHYRYRARSTASGLGRRCRRWRCLRRVATRSDVMNICRRRRIAKKCRHHHHQGYRNDSG